jgi:hypothetical protein
MLTKIDTKVVRQPDSRVRRTWYQSASSDAILVHDADTGEFLSFELEWEGRRGVQRSYLTWTRGFALRSGRVDTGEGAGALHYKAAPMIVWDRQVDPDHVAEARRLIEHSCIEEGLRESLLKRLAL